MYWSISTCTYTLSTLVVIGWGCFPQPVMFCYENGTGQISSLWVNGWRSSMLDIFGRTINPSSPTILYNPYMRAFRKLPILRRIINMYIYIYIYIYTCMYGMIWFCFCLVKLIQQPKHAQTHGGFGRRRVAQVPSASVSLERSAGRSMMATGFPGS